MKNVRILAENRTVEYYQNGKLHREDGPAREFRDGRKEWWWNGKLHRIGGPAIETTDGSYFAWYYHGMLHREGNPAVIDRNLGEFREEWWHWGELHREDGPACISEQDHKEWWLHNILVPEFVVMEPHEITIQSITEAQNHEIRSIMIELYGWQQFVADLDAKLIDSTKNDEDEIEQFLFSCGNFGNVLVLQYPTGRIYTTTEIPDNVTTCAEAHDLGHLVHSESHFNQ
jgi:hypothetical protein